MSECGGGEFRVGGEQEPYTVDEILKRFLDYIDMQKPGLKRFYKWGTQDEVDQYLRDPVIRGLAMTQKLMDNGCPRETAVALSLLALYDLVILIDNSLSMGIGEAGARVETLGKTLRAASTVYSFAEQAGITAVRFLNTSTKYSNVTPDKITALMKKIVFEGLTDIGNKLQHRVLVNHITPDMKKPLLVIIITDGEIEGEPIDQLRNAITNQAVELRNEHGDHGPEAVAYQLAKIGNDKAAENLVVGLDDDDKLGPYVDCMGGKCRLEDLPKDVWRILPKLFLGAISSYWDTEAPTNATFRNKDDELPSQSIDDGDELEREPNPPSVLKGKKNDSGGGDSRRNSNGSLPHSRKPGSSASPLRRQLWTSPSRNGRASAAIPAKSPANGSPPTDSKADTMIQAKVPANGSPQPDSKANATNQTHSPANATTNQAKSPANGSPPTDSQANTTVQDKTPANGSSPTDSQANTAIQDKTPASGSPPAHSQANPSSPTDGRVSPSPPSNRYRPIQAGIGSWPFKMVNNPEASRSPNGPINTTTPPPTSNDASPTQDSRGSGFFQLGNFSDMSLSSSSRAQAGPSPNGQADIPPSSPPRNRQRMSLPPDSQINTDSLIDDQLSGSPGRRGRSDRLKRVIRAFQPGDGVPRSV